MRQKNWIPTMLLLLILISGFWFRYQGIVKELSYWNDESHAATYARALVKTGRAVNPNGISTGLYQSAFYAVTASSFALLGVNEFAGRLPSVIAGTVLIAAIYFAASSMVGRRVGIGAALITAFSQMQLAWSTQLRPYVWLELCTVGIVYCCYRSIRHHRQFIDAYLLGAAGLTVVAFLFHATGLMNVVVIGIAIGLKALVQKRYTYLLLLIPVAAIFIALLYLMFHTVFSLLFRFENDTLHYRIFLTQNYKWLLAGAALGAVALYRKHRELSIFLILTVIAIFAMALFKIQARYVRYSLTAFPFLYILYATGAVAVIDYIGARTKNWFMPAVYLIVIAAFLIMPIKKNKILAAPRYYYTINADMRENPIVDYKRAFEKIEALIGKRRDVMVLDAWNDRVPWYLPGQQFIFMDRFTTVKKDPLYGEQVIATVSEFEEVKQERRAGIVILENWESHAPPEMQEYIRKTLTHEFDIENLPFNEDDKWSISVYSWGL